jgi:hypothetical protein
MQIYLFVTTYFCKKYLMQIVVFSTGNEWEVLQAAADKIKWLKAGDSNSMADYPNAAAFFVMDKNLLSNYNQAEKPVFLNSVTTTLQELNLPKHVLRINGWPGFLQRDLWEVAGTINDNAAIVLEKLNKKIAPVKDEPGLVSARIIAMIINEAYFALGDKVSTKEEIDIAMKLGTNYPWGPFEWAEKIGINNIFDLLEKLSITDKRYLPAPLLTEAITKKK